MEFDTIYLKVEDLRKEWSEILGDGDRNIRSIGSFHSLRAINNSLIIKKIKNSLKVKSEFSNFINLNKLTILDLDLYFSYKNITEDTNLKILKLSSILNNLRFFEFRTKNSALFERYFKNSSLIKYKLIKSMFEHDDLKRTKALSSKDYVKLYNFMPRADFKNYLDLESIEEDFIIYKSIDDRRRGYKIMRNSLKKQRDLIFSLIKHKIESSKERFNFIQNLSLDTEETIFLLSKYFSVVNNNDFDGGPFFRDRLGELNSDISYVFGRKGKDIETRLIEKKILRKEECGIRILPRTIALIEDGVYDETLEKEIEENRLFKVIKSKVDFESIFLPEYKKKLIENTLSQIKNYDLIFNKWGLKDSIEYGKGLIMNFYGPPGTGKTLTARGISNYLKKPILEVNYDNLQGMYVGECEKNIAEVFKIAKESDAIIFIDEADSLIIDREKSKNSWEKTQINVLLKEIENFDGVCIFATNYIKNYDNAIERRLALNLEFELPGIDLRKKIFESHFPKIDALSLDVDFEKLSEKHEFSGGDIKNVILHSARIAACDKDNNEQKIFMRHLEKACELVNSMKFNPVSIGEKCSSSDVFM